MCASNATQETNLNLRGEVPTAAKDKVDKALKVKGEKAAGDGGVTVDLLTDGGNIAPGEREQTIGGEGGAEVLGRPRSSSGVPDCWLAQGGQDGERGGNA